MRLRRLCPKEHGAVIARLDQEFVFKKQRRIGLLNRFPGMKFEEEPGGLWGGELDGHIRSAAAIKIREFRSSGKMFAAALVGWVWVEAESRGKGIGKQMLCQLDAHLKSSQLDFGVLWTGLPAFYETLGWFRSDIGLVAQLRVAGERSVPTGVECRNLREVEIGALEDLRWLHQESGIARSKRDYESIPIPAEEVSCYYIMVGGRITSYALVGMMGTASYIYEVVGELGDVQRLYAAIECRGDQVFVNSYRQSLINPWLSRERAAQWNDHDRAMWRLLSPRLTRQDVAKWHIGYFDWI